MREELEMTADLMVEYLREVILGQKYNWRPLSEEYLEWKKEQGLDDRILIATGDYVDSIQVRKTKRGTGVQIQVGVPAGIHEPSGLPYRTLARIMEFGSSTRGVPARPHWRPAKAWIQRQLPKIREAMAEQMADELKRSTK